ncbi:MAG: hypothetical protein QW594_02800, partial [Candidatus Woesearchaeota archaeon]
MADDLAAFKRKYKERLEQQLGGTADAAIAQPVPSTTSQHYLDFKKERYPAHLTAFEQTCKFAEQLLKLQPDEKKAKEIAAALKTAHIDATPAGVYSLSFLAPLLIILVGLVINAIIPLLIGTSAGFFGIFLFLLLAAGAYYVVGNLPKTFETTWRMQASAEMVLSVFYIVTYMRHTSNLEHAIGFAAEHLTGPLALDLKKVLWDVETQEYDSVKESLDHYLEFWKATNMEYVEAMHLIVSSLYEGSESRRIDALEKSLEVILEETYEKMLHYAQNLKSPITTLHMLGIILPILGLVMLPLIGGFMTSETHPLKIVLVVAGIYNVIIPISVYYFGTTILATRPGGYGQVDLTQVKKYKKYQGILVTIGKKEYTLSPFMIAVGVGLICILIALLPLVLKAISNTDLVYMPNLKDKYKPGSFMAVAYTNPNYDRATFHMLGYKKAKLKEIQGELIGPYGLGASILSLFFPLGIGLMIGLYYHYQTKNLMQIRENSKQLELEFSSSLFQLGNRLGDGLPAEIAFQRVHEVTEGTTTGQFFEIVVANIKQLGLSVREALFDPAVGAVKQFPSQLIESSMKVLVQASSKGPQIAAQALINISKYIKEIHRVDERVKDLMSDIMSSMKSQINFLTPVIAGVVVGITSMVTYILSRLQAQLMLVIEGRSASASMQSFEGMLKMFGDGIPTYYLQIVIGLYV